MDSCESGGRSPASSGSTGNDGHVSLSRSKGEKTALDLRAHVTPARECTDIKDGSTALDANRENEEAAVDPEHTRTLLQAKKSRMPEERISAVTWKPPEVASSDRSFQKGEFESSISVGCFHECEEKDRGKRLEDLNFPPFGHQSPFPHEYTSSTVSSSNTHPADVATRLVVAGVTAALSSVIYLLNMAGRETTRSGSIRSLPERSSKSRLHLSPLLQAVAKPLRHTVENALGQAVTLRTTTPASSWTPRTSSSPFESIYQVADTIAGLRGSMLHAAVCSLSLIPSMVSTAAVHASDREKNFPTMATYPGRANSWGGDDISRSEKRGKRASSSGRERSESPGDGLRLILEYFLIQLQQNTSPAALRAVEEKLTEFLMRPLEWHQFDPVSHEIRRQSQKRDEELKSRQPEARSSPLAFQASLYSVPPPTVWRKHGSPQEGPRAVSSSTLLEKRNDQNIPSARRGASPDLLTSSTQEVLHHANLSSAQRKCGGSSVVLDAERPVEKATTSQMEAQKILAGSHHELADVSSEALPSCSRVPLLSENTPEVQRHLLDRLYRQERRLEEHLKRVQDSERQLTASIQDLERLHVKLLNTTPAYASPHARFSPSALFRGSSDSSNERERLDKETYLERSDFRQISMANDTSKTSSTETSQTRGYVRSLEPDGSMSPAVMRPALPKEEGESLAKTQGSRSSRSQAGDASGPRQDLRVRSLPSTPLQRFLAFAFLLLQLSARAFFTAVKHFFRRLLRLLRKKGRGTPGPKEMGRHASVLSSSAIRTGIVDVVSKGTAVNVSHPNRTLPVAGPGTTSSGYADADAEGNERDVAWIEGHESQVTTAAPGNFTKRRSPSSNLIEHERSPELDISSPELEPDTPPSGTSEGGVAQTATSTQPRCTSKDRHNFRRGDADPTHPKHVQASETPYEHSNSLLLPVIHTSHAKAADSSEPRDAQYRVSTSGQKVGQVVAGTAAAAHGGNIPSRMPSSIPNDHFTESVAADSSTGKERDQQRRTPQGVSGVGVVDEILNDERIVKLLTDRMCRMRGAALKLMQMI
ncbi:abc1 protein, partial [Cystoisospora suis]